MFGYVRPPLGQVEAEQVAQFRHMYCGLCHTLKRRHGFWAQFILNYDFTFLALLLSTGEPPTLCQSRCLSNPVKKQCYYPQSPALDLAADQSVILAYWQLRDHVSDSGFFKGLGYGLASMALKKSYQRAVLSRPAFDQITREQLEALHGLEAENCPSMDRAAHTFATLLAGAAVEVDDLAQRRVLEQLLYHLGRWIYLIDGADDLEKDAKSGNYNPVALRYRLEQGQWTQETKAEFGNVLDHSIHMMATALELRPQTPWTSLLESTVYTGLFAVGHAVLEGSFQAAIGRGHGLIKKAAIEKPKNVEESP